MGTNVLAELKVLLGADISDFEKKMSKANKAADKNLDSMKEFGKGWSLYVTAPILAAATAITVWAAEEETADARLSSSLRNVGVSYNTVTDQVHSYISGLEALSGFEDTSLENSFISLINITGSARTALESLSVVTDVAAGTGKDLETTSLAVGKALEGQNTALKRMGIDLRDNMTPMETLRALMDKFSGTAAQVAQTVQGKWNQIKNSFQNVAETIGHSLEPITKEVEDFALKVIGWLQKLATWFAQQPEPIRKFTVAVAAITAAIGPVLVALAALGSWILWVGSTIAAGGGWAAISGTLYAIAAAAAAAAAPFAILGLQILAVVATFAFFLANGQKVAALLGGIFFGLLQIISNFIAGIIDGLAGLVNYIPGVGEKMAASMRGLSDSVKGFAADSGVAVKDFAAEYDSYGGYVGNTTDLVKFGFSSLAEACGLNMAAVTTAVNSTVPPIQNMGAALDINQKKWKEWSDSLKVTTQQLATGIHAAFGGMVQGVLDTLTSGSQDWKGVLLTFLKASLAATTAWAVAKMTIFEYMSEALAAAISGPWGWLIVGGLIAATIAVGASSIPAMAQGGMTSGPTTALVGDNPSGHEVVMPLDSPRTTNALAKAMPQQGMGGTNQTIVLQLDGRTLTEIVVEGMPAVLQLQAIGR